MTVYTVLNINDSGSYLLVGDTKYLPGTVAPLTDAQAAGLAPGAVSGAGLEEAPEPERASEPERALEPPPPPPVSGRVSR